MEEPEEDANESEHFFSEDEPGEEQLESEEQHLASE